MLLLRSAELEVEVEEFLLGRLSPDAPPALPAAVSAPLAVIQNPSSPRRLPPLPSPSRVGSFGLARRRAHLAHAEGRRVEERLQDRARGVRGPERRLGEPGSGGGSVAARTSRLEIPDRSFQNSTRMREQPLKMLFVYLQN